MAANLKTPANSRRAARGLPSMTERQFDVYLACRDTLRRLRDASRSAADAPPGRPPASS
jgi:hypothetical protein